MVKNGQLDWIFERILSFQEAPFFIAEDKTYSYADLYSDIERWSIELNKLEIEAGESIAVIGEYTPPTVSLFFALIQRNTIIAPLSNDHKNHEKTLAIAEVSGIFTIHDDQTWSFRRSDTKITHGLLKKLHDLRSAGLVLFSSGTTGETKAAVFQVSKLFEKYRETKGTAFRTLVFLKIDHIGGINTLFSIISNGGAVITAQNSTPKEVCKEIEKHRVELFPTTPTFLTMLLFSKDYTRFDLSSLKMITYGTEPMPETVLHTLNQLFPGIKFKQTYGLTELGIFSTKSRDSRSTWIKIDDSKNQIKIIDKVLWIKSESAMLGYLNAPNPFDEEGWYNTGDKVEVDGEYIKILGRETEIINVAGEKVYPIEVENVILKMPEIQDVLVTGKKNPLTGQLVMAQVLLKENIVADDMEKKIINFCRDYLEDFKIPYIIKFETDGFAGARGKKIRKDTGA